MGQTSAKTVSWWGTEPPVTEEPWAMENQGTTRQPAGTEVPRMREEPWETTAPSERELIWAIEDQRRTRPPAKTEEPWMTEHQHWMPPTREPTSTTEEPYDPDCYNINFGIVMHPSQCSMIILCSFGMGEELHCPGGEIFSWKTLSCGPDNSCSEYFEGHGNNHLLESEACKRHTQKYAEHPYEFYQYVDCANLTTLSCPSDQIFRWDYQRCLPGSQTSNQLQPVSVNCGFWGQKAHPYLCEQYFQCQGWIPSLKSCPHGRIFHSPSNGCRRGNFQTCQYTD